MKQLLRKSIPRVWVEKFSDGCVALFPSIRKRYAPPTSSHGAMFPLGIANAGKEVLLDCIPSETTKAERRFLYHFFRSVWSGRNDVLEVGPFLGGTTRAIAMGMMDHPQRTQASRLHTYDRFKNYRSDESLLDFMAPLFENGTLIESDRDVIRQTTDFETVFHRVHQAQPYHPLIRCVNGTLPDLPEQEQTVPNLFAVADGVTLDAVFIDGCKSWYGTRYFMAHVLPYAQPGTWFLMQDYGQHTCFWLPVFWEVFTDAFTLGPYVDSTYTFQLTRNISPEEVAELFPAQPDEWTEQRFNEIFASLIQKACDRDDDRARVVYHVQWAAALAYIGLEDRARAILNDLRRAAWADGSENFIAWVKGCLTYRPGPTGSINVRLDS
jgi:hypothetical protein